EQQGDEPRHQEPDRVEQAVVAVERDGSGDAEERRRRQVVARDRDAVLPAREGPAARVVLGGGAVAARGWQPDRERDRDEHPETDDVEQVVADVHQTCPSSISTRIASAFGSMLRFAWRTYSHVSRNVVTNCPKLMSRPRLTSPITGVDMSSTA